MHGEAGTGGQGARGPARVLGPRGAVLCSPSQPALARGAAWASHRRPVPLTFGPREEQLVRGVQAEDGLGVALGHGDALQRGRPRALGPSDGRDDAPGGGRERGGACQLGESPGRAMRVARGHRAARGPGPDQRAPSAMPPSPRQEEGARTGRGASPAAGARRHAQHSRGDSPGTGGSSGGRRPRPRGALRRPRSACWDVKAPAPRAWQRQRPGLPQLLRLSRLRHASARRGVGAGARCRGGTTHTRGAPTRGPAPCARTAGSAANSDAAPGPARPALHGPGAAPRRPDSGGGARRVPSARGRPRWPRGLPEALFSGTCGTRPGPSYVPA